MRGIVYQIDSFDRLAELLERGEEELELELLEPSDLREGEWVLVSFVVGAETTALAACACDRGEGLRLSFTTRDWNRLQSFSRVAPAVTDLVECVQSTPNPLTAPPGARVLVIDDDHDLQGVLTRMLRSSGFDVVTASSGEEAFDCLRSAPASLLVLDWNLPGMSGLEFCQRVRQDALLHHLPILFLTSHSSPEDIRRAFQAGADDFLSKPFRIPELGARVLGLLQRAKSA